MMKSTSHMDFSVFLTTIFLSLVSIYIKVQKYGVNNGLFQNNGNFVCVEIIVS